MGEVASPPLVVLGAELKVEKYHGDFGACDAEDGEDNEGEAEYVVVLVHPPEGRSFEHSKISLTMRAAAAGGAPSDGRTWKRG